MDKGYARYEKAKAILENLLNHNQQTVSQALYLLGTIYQKGLDVKKDPQDRILLLHSTKRVLII